MSKNLANAAFDKSVYLIKLGIFFSGVNVYNENETPLLKNISILFYINVIWVYKAVIGELTCIYAFIKEGKSFDEVSVVAPFPLICTLGTIKVAAIFVNKHRVVRVLKVLRQLHPNDTEFETDIAERSKEVINSTKKVLYAFVNGMCVGLTFNIILFCAVPLTSMAMDYYKFGETDFKLPYHVLFFYDAYDLPWWPLDYFHQFVCSLIVCVNIFASDALYYAFCLYIRMHLEILCTRFETLRKTDMSECLVKLVLKHQVLIELVNDIQKVYSTSFLCNIITSSFTICFCGFNLTVIKDLGVAFSFFHFLVMSLYQVFVLSFFGDIIRVSSMKIGDAVYNSEWYEAQPTFKKSLFIIIMRSQKPCSLSAAKFTTLTLTTFTKILSQSWSYFALLRTKYR